MCYHFFLLDESERGMTARILDGTKIRDEVLLN